MDSGGSNDTVVNKVNTDPWGPQQEPLQFGFDEARKNYDSSQPSYFPGSTVVSQSPETLQGLDMTANRAIGGNPLTQQSQEYASNVLGGRMLAGNPFFQGAFESQVRPAVDQYKNVIAPGIDSQFAGGATSRAGSPSHAQARNTADDTFARALSDTAASMAYQNYGQERGMQQDAMKQAGGLAAMDYMDPQQLMGVGAARESQGQAELQDTVNRYDFEQNQAANKLAQYMGMVGGPMGSSRISTTPVQGTSTGMGLLGGGMAGASIGNMIMPGGSGAGYGAGLGALLGLF